MEYNMLNSQKQIQHRDYKYFPKSTVMADSCKLGMA